MHRCRKLLCGEFVTNPLQQESSHPSRGFSQHPIESSTMLPAFPQYARGRCLGGALFLGFVLVGTAAASSPATLFKSLEVGIGSSCCLPQAHAALTLAARKRCATLYHNPGAMPFFSPLTNLLFDSPFRRRAVARSCKRPRRCFLGPSWPALHPRRSTCVAGEQAMCCASHKVCEPCLRETAPPRQRTCAFRGGSLRAQATSKSS
jgi:hypothetical protein